MERRWKRREEEEISLQPIWKVPPPPGCEEIGARWAKEQELDSIKLPQLFTGYETEVNVYFN